MKKRLVRLVLSGLTALTLCGCSLGLGSRVPADWYEGTLEYYREGFSSDWANEREDLFIHDEMKDPNNKFGYLLRDLNFLSVSSMIPKRPNSPICLSGIAISVHSDPLIAVKDTICTSATITLLRWIHGTAPRPRLITWYTNPRGMLFSLLTEEAIPDISNLPNSN